MTEQTDHVVVNEAAKSWGQVAHDAYTGHLRAWQARINLTMADALDIPVETITAPVPEWDTIHPDIKEAWQVAAVAVAEARQGER